MKIIALISGILFLVVFLWVNTSGTGGNSPEIQYSMIGNASFVPVVSDGPGQPSNQEAEPGLPAIAQTAHYVVIGSYTSFDQAQQMAGKYESTLGTDIIILSPTPQGYYRLSYGSYPTSAAASAALITFRETSNQEAWILSSE